MSKTPRTDVIVEELVTNFLHNWIRRDDFPDRDSGLDKRVEKSLDQGAKPIEKIRQLEREVATLREATIEECARTLESEPWLGRSMITMADAVAALRALKNRERTDETGIVRSHKNSEGI